MLTCKYILYKFEHFIEKLVVKYFNVQKLHMTYILVKTSQSE